MNNVLKVYFQQDKEFVNTMDKLLLLLDEIGEFAEEMSRSELAQKESNLIEMDKCLPKNGTDQN